ncbi:hypothetical protein DPX16_3615 [Anabarilius grahami]|uniref:Uncharacterized protein n=1 Tax=Anabarilius grahami TaxID=495550 RepID=A0A3N0XR25_ANAGA|nr:hypothetical protein DPX16_3615 [Anabarilius grahami]
MIRWPDGLTSSDADSTFRIGRKKADEDQLQSTVRKTLRKLSWPTKKNCPTADRRHGASSNTAGQNLTSKRVQPRDILLKRDSSGFCGVLSLVTVSVELYAFVC